jgi:hypothetical protein
MTQKNYDLAQFHMLLTDYMTRTDDENADRCDSLTPIDTPTALLDTPCGLLRYVRTCARFQVKLLGTQLEKLDPLIEPELFQMLESLSNRAYDLWDYSGECTRR